MPKAQKRAGSKPVTPEEKQAAILRVANGESKASVARAMNTPESTLRGWCKSAAKIGYQVAQRARSTPPTSDESSEPPHGQGRRSRSEPLQPFNLGVNPTSPIVHAPSSESLYTPATFSNMDVEHLPSTPQSLTIKNETPNSAASQERYRPAEIERNHAELARLGQQLGLDRPEMFAVNPNLVADVSTQMHVLANWNMLFQQIQAGKPEQSTLQQATLQQPILKQGNPEPSTLQQVILERASLQQAIILQQAAKQAAQVRVQAREARRQRRSVQRPVSTSPLVSVPTTSAVQEQPQPQQQYVNGWPGSSSHEAPTNGRPAIVSRVSYAAPDSWYKRYYNRSILQQQLSGEDSGEGDFQDEPENLSVDANRSMSALDMCIHSNNNNNNVDDDVEDNYQEILRHGENMLKCLDRCNLNPLVTQLHISQFKDLLDKVKRVRDMNDGKNKNVGRVQSRK